MVPKIIQGGRHTDDRGTLFFNNTFDASNIKRLYLIENNDTTFVRGWQGHRIEQRWFSAMQGSFEIKLIAIDNWETPAKDLNALTFIVNAEKMDVLHVPGGYVSSIRSIEESSKLLVLSDYLLGEIKDEYRYAVDYFKIKKYI